MLTTNIPCDGCRTTGDGRLGLELTRNNYGELLCDDCLLESVLEEEDRMRPGEWAEDQRRHAEALRAQKVWNAEVSGGLFWKGGWA